MPTPLSSNMNLPIPIPTVTEGAQYAYDEQSCFNAIDAHNHTTGQGAQIPTGGLNINANLPMNNYGLLNTQLVNLQAQGSISTNGSLFRISDDLYFKDGAGNNVRITQSGSVAVSGAIGFTGLPSGTASASYSAPAQSFIFESATNTPANVDMASAIIRPLSANANGITIGAPALLPADYSLELPSALPAITSLAQINATGLIDYANADNSSLELVASVLKIKDLGVTTAKIDNLAVTTGKIADLNVTRAKLQAVGQQAASPSDYSVNNDTGYVDVTGATITITSTGRPVLVIIDIGALNVNNQYSGYENNLGSIKLVRDVTDLKIYSAQIVATDANSGAVGLLMLRVPFNAVYFDAVAAGTYTYKLQASASYQAGTGQLALNNIKLTAYEL